MFTVFGVKRTCAHRISLGYYSSHYGQPSRVVSYFEPGFRAYKICNVLIYPKPDLW